ncbi:MAG: hypothetical protein Q9223_005289 [Gallowayella weberi]
MDQESSYAPSATSYQSSSTGYQASSTEGIPSVSYQSSSTANAPSASYQPSSTAGASSTHQSSSMANRGPSASMNPTQASSVTVRGDAPRRAVTTDRAPPPLPFFSQGIVCQGMVYCSGQIGMSPITKRMVDGGVGDRTAQALNNLSAVLEAAGSSLRSVVECNVFLTDMTSFAAMNRVYDTFFDEPKPV